MLPEPLFYLFGKGVYAYGLCIAIGIISCICVLFAYTKKKGVPSKVQDYVFLVAIVGIAVGFLFAKLFQAFYDWIETGVFDFYGAGITVMGGLIGGAAAFVLLYFLAGPLVFKGKEKGSHLKYFNDVVLIAPICITVAHAFGRIGCLMAGCCHGEYLGKEYVFGGIYMNGRSNGWGYYVPTQLYEALFLFVLFGVLTYLYFNRCNIIMSLYLFGYALWRMIIEFFRADERGGFVLGMSPSQWMSIVFVLIGAILLIVYKVKKIPLFFPKDPPEEKKDGNSPEALPPEERST